MNFDAAGKIANAVLYEGYMLYPYRPSALKNQQRWNFGTLYPAQFEEVRRGTERNWMHVECLLQGDFKAPLGIRVRFLQLANEGPQWNGCSEREIDFLAGPQPSPLRFGFPTNEGVLRGSLHVSAQALGDSLSKLSLDLINESQCEPSATRDKALASSLLSAHTILHFDSGEFISLLDPPSNLRKHASECRSIGCFPVLVGDQAQRNMLLCSPIILYDYPQIAPESIGDFCDGTEMDEMLTLRVITMTSEEKAEMTTADNYARSLLERTEQTAREQLMRTHGTIRSMRPVNDHE